MADVLPGYRFNTASMRYVSQTTGRFVARGQITTLLDNAVREGEDRLAQLTIALHEKQISPATFVEQMATEIKRQHLQNRALGAGGWDRLTQADYGAVGGKLRVEYGRLANFAADIAEGRSSLAQSLNRAGMYAGTARVQYWDALRERQRPQAGRVLIERRILGAAEHCSDCVDYYSRGWQPHGSLPSPGVGSQCLSNCKCTIVSREVDALVVGEWLNTRR